MTFEFQLERESASAARILLVMELELDDQKAEESTAFVMFRRALAENGLTWEDVKENVPPFLNSIGIIDHDDRHGCQMAIARFLDRM